MEIFIKTIGVIALIAAASVFACLVGNTWNKFDDCMDKYLNETENK